MGQAVILGQVVGCSEPLMLRLLAGFDDESACRQLPGLPNHPIWILGHCGFTMSRVATIFDEVEVPATDFSEGLPSEGPRTSFEIPTICRGSVPTSQGMTYPNLQRSQEIYAAACQRFAQAVSQIKDHELHVDLQWHDGPISKINLIARVCFHNGAHNGQILDMRRALKMPRVIG